METKTRSTAHVGTAEGRAVRMPGTRLYTRKVGGEQTGGAYALFDVEVGPAGGEGSHVQHREDECFYVLEGRFEFFVEGTRIEAGPGSLVYVPKGELHAFKNVGETSGKLLVLHTPGGAYEHFIEEAGEAVTVGAEAITDRNALLAGGPTDTGRFTRIAAEYGIEVVPPP